MEVNWNRQLSMHDTGNLFKEILYYNQFMVSERLIQLPKKEPNHCN